MMASSLSRLTWGKARESIRRKSIGWLAIPYGDRTSIAPKLLSYGIWLKVTLIGRLKCPIRRVTVLSLRALRALPCCVFGLKRLPRSTSAEKRAKDTKR
jgi:hypothetical protein